MIADLDETIRQLLIEGLPIKNGEVDIKFEQPKREWSARLSKPTVNLFLYDVRENNILRQMQWEPVREGNGTSTKKRSPMRVDCFYMLTTWASDPEDEHRLLSRSMLALFRHPILPEDRLIGLMRNPKYEIQARLAAHDRLTNPAEVWSSLDNEIRPSISYVVTLALDPWQEVTGPLVRTVTFRAGQAYAPDRQQSLQTGGEALNLVTIGGTVHEKGNGQKPLTGIQVAVKGTGMFAQSDAQGRFRLGGLLPGQYTLVAWMPDGKTIERRVKLPADDGDYDILV
jgi:hypothetical protein